MGDSQQNVATILHGGEGVGNGAYKLEPSNENFHVRNGIYRAKRIK